MSVARMFGGCQWQGCLVAVSARRMFGDCQWQGCLVAVSGEDVW